MKNQEKKIIQDTINFLLIDRMSYLLQHLNKSNESLITEIMREYNTDKFGFEVEEKFFELGLIEEEHHNHIKSIEKHIVGLNSLLKGSDKIEGATDIEFQMKKIQAKKYITTKEFKEIYNVSISSQAQYRGRLHDPLPYHQKVEGGKIVYVVEEVRKWFENQHK